MEDRELEDGEWESTTRMEQTQNSARVPELAKEGVNKRRNKNQVQNGYGANEHNRKHH